MPVANQPAFGMLMSAVIAQNQPESGDQEIDARRMSAKSTINYYQNLPLTEMGGDKGATFKFWSTYSTTADPAQKCLARLARKYLTPPPTSTGMFCHILQNIPL